MLKYKNEFNFVKVLYSTEFRLRVYFADIHMVKSTFLKKVEIVHNSVKLEQISSTEKGYCCIETNFYKTFHFTADIPRKIQKERKEGKKKRKSSLIIVSETYERIISSLTQYCRLDCMIMTSSMHLALYYIDCICYCTIHYYCNYGASYGVSQDAG